MSITRTEQLKPWQRKFFKSIYRIQFVSLSNEATERFCAELATLNCYDDDERNFLVSKIKNNGFYPCQQIARQIFICQSLLPGQSVEAKKQIIAYFIKSLLKQLSIIYADKSRSHDEESAKDLEIFWDFIERNIHASITSGFDEQAFKETMFERYFNYILMGYLCTNEKGIGYTKANFTSTVKEKDEKLQTYQRKILQSIFTETDVPLKIHAALFADIRARTEKDFYKHFLTRKMYLALTIMTAMTLFFLVCGSLAYYFLPEFMSSALWAFAFGSLSFTLKWGMEAYQKDMLFLAPDFLPSIFRKAAEDLQALTETLEMNEIDFIPEVPLTPKSLQMILQDIAKSDFSKPDRGDLELIFKAYIILEHRIIGPSALKEKTALTANGLETEYTRFADAPKPAPQHSTAASNETPQLTLTALKKAKGRNPQPSKPQSTQLINRSLTKYKLATPVLSGALIQGQRDNNHKSLIYVDFPDHQAAHEGIIARIKAGEFDFCAAQGKIGFKFIAGDSSKPDIYRLKSFKDNIRWNFYKSREVKVISDTGETKTVPGWSCKEYLNKRN